MNWRGKDLACWCAPEAMSWRRAVATGQWVIIVLDENNDWIGFAGSHGRPVAGLQEFAGEKKDSVQGRKASAGFLRAWRAVLI
jgi:hypothetical protein